MIPPDPERLAIGSEVMASQLRKGCRVEVLTVGEAVTGDLIRPGQQLTVGERSDGGTAWAFIGSDGNSFKLDHKQADALIVRILETPAV